MHIREIMSDDVAWIPPQTTLRQAAARMRDGDLGILPVGSDDRLVGVVTDRDLAVRGIAAGLGPDETTVADVLTDQVLYCFEDEEVEAVARNMGLQAIRRLPVLDRDKRLVGIVSLGDVAQRGDAKGAGAALGQMVAA